MILKWVVKVQNVNVESVFKQVAHPARADSSKNSLKHELIEGITTPSWREHSIGFPNNLQVPIFSSGWGKALWEKSILPKNTTHIDLAMSWTPTVLWPWSSANWPCTCNMPPCLPNVFCNKISPRSWGIAATHIKRWEKGLKQT